MNSRRRIACPEVRKRAIVTAKTSRLEEAADVRFGSKADICSVKSHVRFTPESDIKCDVTECR